MLRLLHAIMKRTIVVAFLLFVLHRVLASVQNAKRPAFAPQEPLDTAPSSIDQHDRPLAHSPPPSTGPDIKIWPLGVLPGTPQWAVVYYPYNGDATCKSLLTVRADIAAIARAGFTTVRLHASDCGALYKVGSAARLHHLKLIIGVHIGEEGLAPGSTGLAEAEAQIQDIISWASFSTISSYSSATSQPRPRTSGFDLVELIVLGEDSLFNAYTSPPELAAFLNNSRLALQNARYDGPLTTTEPIATLYTHSATLCPAIDIPAANIQPYFHASVSSALAADYVSSAMKALGSICAGKSQPVSLETGWPSRGKSNGRAHAGLDEQREAISSVLRREGHRTVLLGWGDDAWKDPGDFGVEDAWGCERIFGDGMSQDVLQG